MSAGRSPTSNPTCGCPTCGRSFHELSIRWRPMKAKLKTTTESGIRLESVLIGQRITRLTALSSSSLNLKEKDGPNRNESSRTKIRFYGIDDADRNSRPEDRSLSIGNRRAPPKTGENARPVAGFVHPLQRAIR